MPEEAEAAWFHELIDGFQREYELWSTSARIRRYLDAVHRHCESAPMRVICFAYLHVVYDLPRVIARTLRSGRISRQRAREVYAKAGPLLLSVFDRCHTDPAIWGWYASLFRFVPRRFSVSRVLAYWILAHRAAAWIKAETLAEVEDHEHYELDLWVRMEAAALPQIEQRAGMIALLGWLSTADTLGMVLYRDAGSAPKPGLHKGVPQTQKITHFLTEEPTIESSQTNH